MISAKTVTTAGSILLLTGVLSAAPYNPQVGIAKESSDFAKAFTVMSNELLNNREEEFIVLGSTQYFNGFNDGMTLAIADTTSFALTGNEALDISDIGAELAQLQNAANAVGTDYSRGEATAYAYANIVLNTPFDRSSGSPAPLRSILRGPTTEAPVAPIAKVTIARTEPLRLPPLRLDTYLP
jgi:hypothetical protein